MVARTVVIAIVGTALETMNASEIGAYAADDFKVCSDPDVEACLRFVDAGGNFDHRQPHRGGPDDGRPGTHILPNGATSGAFQADGRRRREDV